MELKSKFIGFAFDCLQKKWVVTFSVESTGEILQNLFDEFKDKILDLKLKVHRDKRSLDANAYYWSMLSKLADKLHQSNNATHNMLLAEYSEVEMIDGQVVEVWIKESEKALHDVREASDHHLKPTSNLTFRDGELFRTYQLMKGSSQMDTKQMSRLINGLLDECHEVGIPTITEEEAERMIAAYGHSIR